VRWVWLLLVPLIAGCGSGGSEKVATIPTRTPTLVPTATFLDSAIADHLVTSKDSGRSYTLAVGERLLLSLDPELEWTITVSDPAVIDRQPDAAVPAGAQGVYIAKSQGRSTLQGSGTPACRKATPPCDKPTVAFQIKISVP